MQRAHTIFSCEVLSHTHTHTHIFIYIYLVWYNIFIKWVAMYFLFSLYVLFFLQWNTHTIVCCMCLYMALNEIKFPFILAFFLSICLGFEREQNDSITIYFNKLIQYVRAHTHTHTAYFLMFALYYEWLINMESNILEREWNQLAYISSLAAAKC